MRPSVLSLLLLFAAQATAAADDASTAFQKQVLPILTAHCTECHGGEKPKAKLDLAGPRTLEQLRTQSHHWFNLLERVEAGTMPPKSSEPLKPAEKAAIAAWINGEFRALLLERQREEGRSKFRRLSRGEYANTVYDIFGVRPPVVRLLPADGRVDGYDKVSAALPFSTAVTEGQLRIAEDIANRMFEIPEKKMTYRLWSVGSEQSKGHVLQLPDNWNVSFNTDTTSGPLRKGTGPEGKNPTGFPGPRKPGLHRLRISAYGYQTDKPLPVGIYVGHVFAYPQLLDLIKVIEIPPGKPSIVETEVYLRMGRDSDFGVDDGIRLIPLGLGVPVPKNTQASVLGKGPGLALQWVDVEELEESLPGQRLFTAEMPTAIRTVFNQPNGTLKSAKLSRDELQAFVTKAFGTLGARLFRRDLTAPELSKYVGSFMKTADAGGALRPAFVNEIAAMMTAPDFLCVVEKPGKLSDFALASRLSYFLWNSAPDEELLDVARKGKLSDPQVLRAQTERLLNASKSERFVKDFLDQWLGLWGIENTTPDKDLYPEYDDLLKFSSVMETQATFRKMLDKNLSVRDFVAPQWAMVNARLAKHYGFPGVEGFGIREVRLPAETPFGGIWTQAATMKVTANGTLTSPVKRGVWVAERLLGTPIPPPPANIEPVDPDTRGAKTLREQLALHSSKGSCAACHARFDPYGFALESFDVMGNFRTKYRAVDSTAPKGKSKWKDGLPVDSTGVTPDGKAFAGVTQLREMLAKNPEALARGVTRLLLTYATGQPAGPVDQSVIEAIVKGAAKDEYGLRSLVHGVVQSELFRSK
jgi:mono/diheme cytochrome c family protein